MILVAFFGRDIYTSLFIVWKCEGKRGPQFGTLIPQANLKNSKTHVSYIRKKTKQIKRQKYNNYHKIYFYASSKSIYKMLKGQNITFKYSMCQTLKHHVSVGDGFATTPAAELKEDDSKGVNICLFGNASVVGWLRWLMKLLVDWMDGWMDGLFVWLFDV